MNDSGALSKNRQLNDLNTLSASNASQKMINGSKSAARSRAAIGHKIVFEDPVSALNLSEDKWNDLV